MAIRLWGTESRINVAGEQNLPQVAGLVGGGYVLIWEDRAVAANPVIRGQRYAADGSAVGAQFVVDQPARDPHVTALADGGWLVGWHFSVSGTDTDPYVRRYSAAGVASGFQNLDGAVNLEDQVAVSALGAGYVAVWRDQSQTTGDIEFQRFDGAGALLGAKTVVNTTTAGSQGYPDVAQLAGGRFAVVWISGTDLKARVFNADGTAASVEFNVVTAQTFSPAEDEPLSITALANGGFVVAYHTATPGFPDTSSFGIRAVIYDSNGAYFTGPTLVNTTTASAQAHPDLIPLANGGFLAVWHHNRGPSAGFDIRAQAFDMFGQRDGDEIVVSTTSTFAGNFPSATLLSDGRVAISWAQYLSDTDFTQVDIITQIIDPRDGQVQGDGGANTLYGGDFDDQISGLGGADVLFAQGGDDLIYGGEGADTAFGFTGSDIGYGGAGNDTLNGGTGDDIIHGEADNDTIFGELGDDLFFGGDGDDVMNGNFGQDVLYGGNGADTMFGEDGGDAFFGGEGGDFVNGGEGSDVVNGENGGDVLIGDNGDDVLDGGAQGDILNGGQGVDSLFGGGDGDTLIGGPGGTPINPGGGADIIWYQSQVDVNDLIVGFVSADDQLQFTGAQFGGFTAGSNLSAGLTFIAGANPNPTGAVPTFLYNSSDGSLFFDADGTGPARIFVALLQGAPTLTAGDFQFV